MKIMILHFRSAPAARAEGRPLRTDATDSAGTDGVSLEMQKRQELLEAMGHEVVIGSAYDWADLAIPALEFDRQEVMSLNRNLFGGSIQDFAGASELEAAFHEAVARLRNELQAGLEKLAPEMLFVHNMLALPVHPAATIALAELLAETHLPCVAIHHDILSEGAYKFQPSCDFAQALLDSYFPPKLPNLSHWTINTRNQRALRIKAIRANLIHDTMDFHRRLDAESHRSLRSEIRGKHDISKSDIVLFAGARITPNKQLELAGQLAAALWKRRGDLVSKPLYNGEVFGSDSRVLLVLAGRPERGFADYQGRLFASFDELNLHWLHVGETVLPVRAPEAGCYALYPDMYTIADFVLYPSDWEGFGNQLLEAFAAGLPVAVFEYPVFKEDIAPKQVKVVSLGDTLAQARSSSHLARLPQEVSERAAQEMVTLLTDAQAREAVTNHNIEVGRRYFDFEALRAHLQEGVSWASSLRARA